jgi:hypothetical protein
MVVADTVVCVAMVVSSVAWVASRQLMIVSTVASQAMIIIGVAPSSVFCRVSSLIVGFWEAAAYPGVAIFTDVVGVFWSKFCLGGSAAAWKNSRGKRDMSSS